MIIKKVFTLLIWILASGAAHALDPFQPLPPQPPVPADNPMSDAKVELGQQLFFDPRLSISGTHACYTCHNVSAGGDDGRAVSEGVYGRKGHRNTMPIWNAAYHTVYNWDGGAKTLEQQFRIHVTDPVIMGMPDGAAVVARLAGIPGYLAAFGDVFPDTGLTFENIAKAIAAYERTLVTPNSAFDRYLQGDEAAISEQAKRGFQEFIDVQCASCHFWVNLAGPIPGIALQQGEGFYELFPNYPGTDVERRYRLADDLGRYHLTLSEIDRRKWRMPGLRNVAVTAPYFHNGSVATLEEAVRVMAITQLKRELSERQVADIVEFLQTLTGPFPPQTLPRLPPTPLRAAVSEGR